MLWFIVLFDFNVAKHLQKTLNNKNKTGKMQKTVKTIKIKIKKRKYERINKNKTKKAGAIVHKKCD